MSSIADLICCGDKYFLPLNLSTRSVSRHSVNVRMTKLSIDLKQPQKELKEKEKKEIV